MPNTANSIEHRKVPRAPIGVVVRVTSSSGGAQYYSDNLSSGGMFLLTTKPPEVESHVKLEFLLPLVDAPVQAEGEVAWVQRLEPTGFAVRFTQISDRSRELIRWVVDRQLFRTCTSPNRSSLRGTPS